jgi:3-hydroxy-9,10-secoandrosta-1,3,5(10)-triene-9,17-dione monooxygenase reductase component
VTGGAEAKPGKSDYRNVFGHLPTGVVVVTGRAPTGEPHGITIGSFTSISLEPPLAGFFIGRSSRTWPLVAATGKFCANVLAASQADLCWRFAKDSAEGSRFDGLLIESSSNGSPVLPGVIATVDCTVHELHQVGDHDLVVGEVSELRVRDGSQPAMIFFKGKTGDAHLDI